MELDATKEEHASRLSADAASLPVTSAAARQARRATLPRHRQIKDSNVCTYLIPYTIQADGQAALLLGLRRTGPAAHMWTEIASDLDAHAIPAPTAGRSLKPQEIVSRAGYAACMGLLGSACQIQAALSTDARVRVTDGFAYFMRVQPEYAHVVDTYNTMARYVTSTFTKDEDKSLMGCPPTLLPFSRVQWVPLPELKLRVQFMGASAAARAVFAEGAARMTLAPRTVDILRHVIPALESCATVV